jgi:hypothetical protein
MHKLLQDFWTDGIAVEIVVSTGYGSVKGSICALFDERMIIWGPASTLFSKNDVLA